MNIQDIVPAFEQLNRRVEVLEKHAHTHEGSEDKGDPVTSALEEIFEEPEPEQEAQPEPEQAAKQSEPEQETEPDPEPEEDAEIELQPDTQSEAEPEDATFQESQKTDAPADIKASIQDDVKVYDAVVVGQALMNQVAQRHGNNDFCRHEAFIMETGETKRVQPFVTTDAKYSVPTEAMLKRILKETDIDRIKWIAEEMDCEKIAREFVDACAELGLTDAVGRIFGVSGNHAFIVALVQDGENVGVKFIEPQNDKFIEPISLKDASAKSQYLREGGDETHLKYNIYNALMVIS